MFKCLDLLYFSPYRFSYFSEFHLDYLQIKQFQGCLQHFLVELQGKLIETERMLTVFHQSCPGSSCQESLLLWRPLDPNHQKFQLRWEQSDSLFANTSIWLFLICLLLMLQFQVVLRCLSNMSLRVYLSR